MPVVREAETANIQGEIALTGEGVVRRMEGRNMMKLTIELREKEKKMLKTPPNSTPHKGKGKDNDMNNEGRETAAK